MKWIKVTIGPENMNFCLFENSVEWFSTFYDNNTDLPLLTKLSKGLYPFYSNGFRNFHKVYLRNIKKFLVRFFLFEVLRDLEVIYTFSKSYIDWWFWISHKHFHFKSNTLTNVYHRVFCPIKIYTLKVHKYLLKLRMIVIMVLASVF